MYIFVMVFLVSSTQYRQLKWLRMWFIPTRSKDQVSSRSIDSLLPPTEMEPYIVSESLSIQLFKFDILFIIFFRLLFFISLVRLWSLISFSSFIFENDLKTICKGCLLLLLAGWISFTLVLILWLDESLIPCLLQCSVVSILSCFSFI